MATPVVEPDIIEGGAVEAPMDNSTLMALTRAEIDQSIMTARAFPRDVAAFVNEVKSLACLDEETAKSMFYTLPRAGKPITGPSARLAEIAASCWGNIRYGARVVEVGSDYVAAQGKCHDLQKNVLSELEVRRRITNAKGDRYNADMIGVTGQAACSIALRNAVFKVIPQAFVKGALDRARLVAGGDAKSLEVNRKAVLDLFTKKGVRPEQIFSFLGIRNAAEMTLEHIGTMNGVVTALKDGAAKLAEFFPDATAAPQPVTKPPQDAPPPEDPLFKAQAPAAAEAPPTVRPAHETVKAMDQAVASMLAAEAAGRARAVQAPATTGCDGKHEWPPCEAADDCWHVKKQAADVEEMMGDPDPVPAPEPCKTCATAKATSAAKKRLVVCSCGVEYKNGQELRDSDEAGS
jgi:hypothetical protein